MATVTLISDEEASAEALAVFADIRKTRGTDFINNFWRALAHDPAQLKRTWDEVKLVMGAPGALDPLTREMIYIAVSTANSCDYCVHSHTAGARAKGMTDAQHAELVSIIALAGKTNQLANALQVPVDKEFEA
jgi:AhpD family alkylhydroperoxidase